MEEFGVAADIRHHPDQVYVKIVALINAVLVNLELAAPLLVGNLQELIMYSERICSEILSELIEISTQKKQVHQSGTSILPIVSSSLPHWEN